MTARASGVAMKRVPTHTPSAPSASAAASPRPSKMPPAATTGTAPSMASTIRGTRGNVATVPVCPPASVPWAMTSVAARVDARARAWSTLPHIDRTSTPWRWQRSTTCDGHAEPGDERARAALDQQLDVAHEVVGERGEQVDAEGPVGEPRASRRSPRPAGRSTWSTRRGSRSRRRSRPRRRARGRRRRPSRPASPGARRPAGQSVGSSRAPPAPRYDGARGPPRRA